MAEHHPHLGRNVKRLREILGMKQETLAVELGSDWSQKKISLLEAKDMIDRPQLEQIAKALKIPVEAIETFDESATVLNIQNNYDSASNNSGPNYNYQCSFDPIDKIVELYERMLEQKDEMIKKLEELGKK